MEHALATRGCSQSCDMHAAGSWYLLSCHALLGWRLIQESHTSANAPTLCLITLLQAEEAWRLAKEQKNHELWDAKMRATQTASAFGIRVT
jgi:hypothetical protein